jgi:hypothetical protein
MLNYRDYLSYAESYLMLAEEKKHQSPDISWLLIPSAIMAWTAIESFVNNRLDDLGSIPTDLELHEKAFLLEKRIKFNSPDALPGAGAVFLLQTFQASP